MRPSPEALDTWFTYHPPFPDQVERYAELRAGGHSLASMILDLCPESADRTTAIRKVREAVMYANAAIACGEADRSP